MEYKSLPLELDDLSMEKGTATIAHAVYDNIDLVKDIARKGMFTKSWKEAKMADGYDIAFYINHDENQTPGRVLNVLDNERKAYTQVKTGSHTLGKDTLIMMDEKVLRKASFGFITTRADRLKSDKAVRELREVKHLETSVLTKLSANPLAGVEKVNKALPALVIELKTLSPDEQKMVQDLIGLHSDALQRIATFAAQVDPTSDLYTTANYWTGRMNDMVSDLKQNFKWNSPRDDDGKIVALKSAEDDAELKEHLENLRKFVRNTKASDETIGKIETEIKSIELSLINTADTSPSAGTPAASDAETKRLTQELYLLSLKHF